MAENHSVNTQEKQPAAPEALNRLKAGNDRYISGRYTDYDFAQQRKETENGQQPFAAVVSCMDSRTSAEIVFDLGLGDIFSIRNAGNVVTDAALGSLEYAVAAVGVKLVVVMGHTACGAVKGACDNVELGHLTALLQEIKPATAAAQNAPGEHNSKNAEFVQQVTHEHAIQGVRRIMERSSVIRDFVEKGQVGLVPAVYDIASGKVQFLEDNAVMQGASMTGQQATA
jgi:carbonic anhydrase